jgi:hypothetical protein
MQLQARTVIAWIMFGAVEPDQHHLRRHAATIVVQ